MNTLLRLPAPQSDAGRQLVSEIRAKADAGDARSQFELGAASFRGDLGVTKDVVEAVKWHRLAAGQNLPGDLNNLAWVLATNPNPAFRDGPNAIILVEKAAVATAYGIAEVIPAIASQIAIFPAFEIAWTTQTTNNYQLQWCSSHNTSNWFSLGVPIQGTGSTNHYFDSTRGADKRFYRVLALP